MNDVFVVCNQLDQFWGKKKKWVDGRDARKIQLCKHDDESINLLFEISSKDIELRGRSVEVEVDERKLPVVTASEHLIEDEPEPVVEALAEEAAEESTPDGESMQAQDTAGAEDTPADNATDPDGKSIP
jgi:hypothetical protein